MLSIHSVRSTLPSASLFALLLGVLLSFVLSFAPLAEASPASTQTDSQAVPPVTAKLLANVKSVPAGQPFKLGVELLMPPDWHTYYKLSGDAGMPTKIVWRLPEGFKAGPLEWERPNTFNDAGITTYGYHDKTLIAASITPPERLPAGKPLSFGAAVKWLQCKDLCVPGKADLTLELTASGSSAYAADHLDEFAKVGYSGEIGAAPAGEPAAISKSEAATSGQTKPINLLSQSLKVEGAAEQPNGLAGYLLLAFVGGFILNFMPCVLPVISIKVLGFVQQAGEDPKQVFRLGLVFTAGILASFLALAILVLLLKQTGQQVGWGFQFQHPVFVIVMAVIVQLFALSLFGLFYISAPAGQAAIDKAASQEGIAGTFFKGVLATTLSTPCTAPFLGTAVGFAFTESWWVVITIFMVVGLGMAFPYLVLTAKPGWMRFIPRPGVWMEKFKESLGFLLLATVIWLLRVLGAQVGFEQALWIAAFLVVISFAVWCVSRYTDLTSSSRRKLTVWSIALVVVGVGYYFCIATVPGLGLPSPQMPISSSERRPTKGEIDWQPFTIDALEMQLSLGKTVFLDFTAEWCLTCKVNEQAVIDTKPVVARMKALKVVAMKADWTRQDPQISALLHKFGRSGVPLYVIFPAGRPTEPIVLPEVITPPIVLDALQKAGASKD
jgi:thiol:disulfide interchange protein DsbD